MLYPYSMSQSRPARPNDHLQDILAHDAAILSAVEVGLGSVLHAFHIPLAGQLLSLNQIFLLTRSSHAIFPNSASRTAPFTISCVAALLKALSPAGKKLTPMIAIAMQGGLFSSGLLLLGANPLGFLFGATLSGLWAFLQPALILLLIFGSTLVDSAKYFLEKVAALLP